MEIARSRTRSKIEAVSVRIRHQRALEGVRGSPPKRPNCSTVHANPTKILTIFQSP